MIQPSFYPYFNYSTLVQLLLVKYIKYKSTLYEYIHFKIKQIYFNQIKLIYNKT